MIQTKKKDIFISITILVISVILWISMGDWPQKSAQYPKFVVGSIILFSIILLCTALFSLSKEKELATVTKEKYDLKPLKGLLKFLIPTLSYVLCIPFLGWLFSSILYLCIEITYYTGVSAKKIVLIVVSIVGINIAVSYGLAMKMPVGLLLDLL